MDKKEYYVVNKVKQPRDFTVSVPGSKSITNRALLLAALAEGSSTLRGVLFSDDSRHFMQALVDLGFSVDISEAEATVSITGFGGEVPCANSRRAGDVDAVIDVGSAGTAARFLTAFLGVSKGRYRITASEQMKKRPMKELLEALEEMGAAIVYEEEPYHFPLVIGDFDCKRSFITVDIEKSSQFLSALLISSVILPEYFMIGMTGTHGMAYVNMTLRMMSQFGVSMEKTITGSYRRRTAKGYDAKDYIVEPDVSGACYFYALSPLLHVAVKVRNVHMNCLQGDIKFLNVLDRMGCHIEEEADGVKLFPPRDGLLGGSFDLSSFSDQALTLAAIAPFASSKVCIMNVGHIRYQECDRIQAILENLIGMGILALCEDDNIFILPGKPKPTTIETFEDHRVAMAFSLPGTVLGEQKILNPACTAKTFENFFEVLGTIY